MKNIIGNKHKRYYRRAVFRYYRAGFILCFIIMSSVLCALYSEKTSPEPAKQTKSIKVVEVEAVEDKYTKRGYAYCYDPIICIRDVGDELGMSNKDITTMVRIAKCESNYKPDAKNPNSTATGIFQIIIGTWDGNRCKGERWNFQDNIKCAWQIYQKRGTQPWISSSKCWDN